MDAHDALLQAFGELARTWGFTVTSPGEAQRPITQGRQRLHCSMLPRQQHWSVSLIARSSFVLDPETEPEDDILSFRTSASCLDPSYPISWSLTPHRVALTVERLRAAYEAHLDPFLAATDTPAGMVRWLCGSYRLMTLISPSPTAPLHRGLQLTSSLPSPERYAARLCLREKIIVVEQVMRRSHRQGQS